MVPFKVMTIQGKDLVSFGREALTLVRVTCCGGLSWRYPACGNTQVLWSGENSVLEVEIRNHWQMAGIETQGRARMNLKWEQEPVELGHLSPRFEILCLVLEK